MGERLRIALVGTYVPRPCGIATFTHDLAKAMAEAQGTSQGGAENPSPFLSTVQVVALTNPPQRYDYGPEVVFEIRADVPEDYRAAAAYLNQAPIDGVCLQHEYGIFGGPDGAYVLELVERLRKPLVVTLHTVLYEPSEGQRRVLIALARRADQVVVMAERARQFLVERYGVPAERITRIDHGAPAMPLEDPGPYKARLGLDGRRVLLTFGLLSPNKGIETMIEAMKRLVPHHPDLLYLVVGATHPEVRRRFGEAYRRFLEEEIARAGLQEHIHFVDRYLDREELLTFLMAADIYVAPYLAREQIVSGTLTYALACGKAIVSTPSWYAEEMLGEGRGLLVPFRDPEAMARALDQLLSNPEEWDRLRRAAYARGREMAWPIVGARYLELFRQVLERPRPGLRPAWLPARPLRLPAVRLEHLRRLTDDTGMLQHARFTIPDRRFGYCTDDNARALLFTVREWQRTGEASLLPLMEVYLAFLQYAWNPETQRFRNFMAYDRRWLESTGSEDAYGRAMWALGEAAAFGPEGIAEPAWTLFQEAWPGAWSLEHPRPWAYAILGGVAMLQRFPGDRRIRAGCLELTRRLEARFEAYARPGWPWCDDRVTYDNGILPAALIAAGYSLQEPRWMERGLVVLNWLVEIQTNPQGGHLSFVGNRGWFPRGGEKARFAQQPIEGAAMAEAAAWAWRATEDRIWLEVLERCVGWFLGWNDRGCALADLKTGGCRDGLEATEVSVHQGAESTLAWLLTLNLAHRFLRPSPEPDREAQPRALSLRRS
ncbi:MAG: glycosyltransferase family 4 protein [Thermoflexus hugenholtzii]|jgi:glycosyltransferase involved in cell wall biosynthesis|uniref:glycosyltransferase family 4 protein n=1 Tax=Thermoflexus TaxID=1495649 RepID=UPI001C74BF34|nr:MULTISPECIES: glycosyltransferase family 4 protein [Thermoflexus]QWK09598.1 MAG: glycosyltransferase family 4 protein [Thermoflexus hugenholtzii]